MTQSPPGGPPPSGDNPDERSPSAQPGRADATGHGSTGPIQTGGPSLSKDPSGGSPAGPPPSGAQPPPTTFQPSYQPGPPPGYQQGPPPGYQPGPPPGAPGGPPPGYQQGPPPGYQQGPPPGYQQGPPPGYQQGPPPGAPGGPPPGYQQGPPPGYQQGPPPDYQQGGYQQPGYPPPGAAYGPPGGQPGYPAAPGAYPPAAGGPKPSFDMSKITISGWGVLGSSLLTLIASFFPFWSVSAAGFIAFTVSLNGWSLWWWLPVLLAVAVGVVYALEIFGIIKPNQVKPEWLVYAAAASFVLMLGVLIQTFAYAGSAFAGTDDISHGPSFGVFIAIITTAALTYFMALAAQSAGAKLPLKVPGPA